MNGLRIASILILTTYYLQAQQLSLFTQYRENATIINPAAVESDFLAFGQNLSFGASYRAQWVGLENAPRTQTFRGSFISKDMTGVSIMAGGHIINDQTGPTGFTGIYARVAGVVTGDPEFNGLSIGLSAGLVQYRIDATKVRLREEGDVIGTQDQSQLFPDVGIGIYYYQLIESGGFDGDYFYTGLSVPQAFGLDLAFQDENGEFLIKRVQHIYGTIGLYKFFNDDSFIEPSVWIKYVQNAPISADINLRYQLPTNIWIGAGVSLSGNFHLDTGFLLGENIGNGNTIKLGYGFDYSFSSFGPSAGSTHEINLTFSFDR